MLRERLMTMLSKRETEMIEIRRHLHAHPELSFHEQATAEYIANFYAGKDVTVTRNIGNGYGIMVTIEGGKPGDTIALRADFDALPIVEETGLPFASENPGVFHGCGHDGHTAYMLVLADCLIACKEELAGTIKIIHQHAEEVPPGGAKSIVDSGILADVKQIYGIHLMPYGEPGDILYHAGNSMGGRDMFKLKVQGVGGHGSSPSTSNDAIVAAAYFVMAIQTVVSRRLNPTDDGVVTIGSFDGKGQFNIIKDAVELEGDVRYIRNEVSPIMEKEIRRIVHGLEEMFGVTTSFEYINDYPILHNTPEVVSEVVESLSKRQGDYVKHLVDAGHGMGSEDFAYYLEKIPGVFFYIGAQPEGVTQPYYNHHPKFDFNEKSLLVAAKAMADIVLDYYELS